MLNSLTQTSQRVVSKRSNPCYNKSTHNTTMNSYTVLFLCARGYKCFRQVTAETPEAARLWVLAQRPTPSQVTEVRLNG